MPPLPALLASQSPTRICAMPPYSRIPALIASKVPTTRSVDRESKLTVVRTAMPYGGPLHQPSSAGASPGESLTIAMPRGVMPV